MAYFPESSLSSYADSSCELSLFSAIGVKVGGANSVNTLDARCDFITSTITLRGGASDTLETRCALYPSTVSLRGDSINSLSVEGSVVSGGSTSNVIYGSSVNSLKSLATLAGFDLSLRGDAVNSLKSSALLAGFSYALRGAAVNTLDSKWNVSVLSDLPESGATDPALLSGRTVVDVVTEILLLWGIDKPSSAPSFAIVRALNDINSSLQSVWNQASDRNYWSNQTLTVAIEAGSGSSALPDNVQNVNGPCRRADNLRPLTGVGTVGELETFMAIYLDGVDPGEPVAYHVKRTMQNGPDPSKCVLHVTPPVVGESINFLLDAVMEAPHFTVADLSENPVIPIPHRYVESLLMPIARYHASSFLLFSSKDNKETIDREYLEAKAMLGMADPLPGKAGDNKEPRKEAAPQK